MGHRTRTDVLHAINADLPPGALAHFSILGTQIELVGRPEQDVTPLTRIYAAFRTNANRPQAKIAWDGCVRPTKLVVDGKAYSGLPRKGISAVISMKIMESVYRRTKNFWLFHGAAAAWKETLLLFPGETGSGKSSLAVGLARRGWALFSDEVIAISVTDTRAAPFPRAISFHAGSDVVREVIPLEESSAYSLPLIGGGAKRIVPYSDFGKPPEPLPPAAIICLEGSNPDFGSSDRAILVTLWNESMELSARKLGVWDRMSVRRNGDFYRIETDRTDLIEDICTSLGGIVIERDAARGRTPIFDDRAVLRPAYPGECLDALWLVFQNGRTLAGGTPGITPLYAELGRLVNKMPCWMLRPGRVEDTCQRLRDLAENLRRGNGARR